MKAFGLFLSAALGCVCVFGVAPGNGATPGEPTNLALGKKYTLVPKPRRCTDAGDLTQLTDGKQAGKDQDIWGQKGSVGWKGELDSDAEVVIDLEKVYPIDSVSVTTGAKPKYHIYLPSFVIAVSDDGEDFRVVRQIDMKHEAQRPRVTVRARNLRTRGRYVLVRFKVDGVYAFTDEIEVRKGTHKAEDVTLGEEKIVPLRVERKLNHLQRRLFRDLDVVNQRAELSTAGRSVLDRIAAVRREVDRSDKTDEETVSVLEGKVREIQRDVARMLYPKDRLAVWRVSPWADISPIEIPPPGNEDACRLRVVAGQNEYESAAVMVANLSAKTVRLEVRLKGLLADPQRWGGVVKLREAMFIKMRKGRLVADALPLLNAGQLKIPAWQSRQLWVQLHTAQAKPGKYHGTIVLAADGGVRKEVPLDVEILPIGIPDDLPVATYSWQDLEVWPSLKGIETAAVADLAAHYTNVSMFSHGRLPWPREFDEEGNIVGELNFRKYDELIALCRPISSKGSTWFLGMKKKKKRSFDKLGRFSEPWKRAFSQWLKAWVKHLRELGMGYDDFFMYPFDEYVGSELVEIGKVIRAADPKLRIFADPMLYGTTDMLKKAAPYVDIWCPALLSTVRRPGHLAVIRQTGKTVWTYTGLYKTRHPYEFGRLSLWRAFRAGATGCGFWCYAQGGSYSDDNLWDDFNGDYSDYGVIYTLKGAPPNVSRSEPIIPSKRWEAWREGVEDYTYLHMLREQTDRAGPGAPHKIAAAKKILNAAVTTVLSHPNDVTLAAKQRQKVLSAIMSLR